MATARLRRAQLSTLCLPVACRTYGSAGVQAKDVNEVLLVGGMTRMPKVSTCGLYVCVRVYVLVFMKSL